MLNGRKSRVPKAKLLGLARKAILDYRASVKMMEAPPTFKARADERQVVLWNLLAKAGVDEGQILKAFGRNGSNGQVPETPTTTAPDPESKTEEVPAEETS